MLVRSWRLGLLSIAIVPITAIINRYYARFLKENQKCVQAALASANIVATECVSSIRMIRSFNTEDAELKKYSSRILTHFSLMMRQIFYTSGYYMVCNTFLINTVVQASILAYVTLRKLFSLLSLSLIFIFSSPRPFFFFIGTVVISYKKTLYPQEFCWPSCCIKESYKSIRKIC